VSAARSNAARPLAKRCASAAATTASSVLPAAIPSAVATEAAVVKFTRKAPTRIAGHMRGPSRSSEAIAMPVPGQIAEALGCTLASESPSRPARK
jgi:hypothetical protein